MKPGNLIRLKKELYCADKSMFLVLSEDSEEDEKLYGPHYGLYIHVLNSDGEIVPIPIHFARYYEIIQ